MTQARQYHQIDSQFTMQHGELYQPIIAYETWGTLNAQRDNAILIFTGLSPSAHAASSAQDTSSGWWEQMIGPARPIDTSRFFVICVNSLGSCFGSTGPASINPNTNKPYRLAFPVLTLEDIARGGQAVIESLGIQQLHSVVGSSMGGMTALCHSILYPDASIGLICISSAARALPYAIALRSVQREIIRSDPAWLNGSYDADKEPSIGMRLARKLGMLTYRSPKEFEQRFGRELIGEERQIGDTFGIDFEVESYLEAHAKKFVGTFDANCYLYLSRAMDLFDVADYGGSLATGFRRVGATRVMIIGVKTDILFPLEQQKELAAGLDNGSREVSLHILDSIQGHDAFLVDMDRFRPLLCEFFNPDDPNAGCLD
ncbi:MAG: homoserine O-acetyltransferase [Candidatus Azotimanducaceae bacterium]|jgi:homoserine O-acetyltransferase